MPRTAKCVGGAVCLYFTSPRGATEFVIEALVVWIMHG